MSRYDDFSVNDDSDDPCLIEDDSKFQGLAPPNKSFNPVKQNQSYASKKIEKRHTKERDREQNNAKSEDVNDRSARKNNIVIYNLPESVTNSRTEDREAAVNLMKKITGKNMVENITEMFRMGKKLTETTNPRPLLIKLNNLTDKNLIMENCPKLRNNRKFQNILINHDLSREDRNEIKRLLDEKKKEIAEKHDVSKWGFKVSGQPGEFSVITHRKDKQEIAYEAAKHFFENIRWRGKNI